jgi:branched-chain amino acid transport system permease protein
MKRALAPLAIFAMLALAIAAPQYITIKYYVQLILLALIWTIVAHGQNIIQGMTGYVSITQAGLMGVGAYASTLLSIRLGWPVWASMAVAPFVTALFSVLVGYPSLRVKGHYFAIVTLAFNMVIFTVLLNYTSLTRGEAGIPNIKRPESLFGLVDFDDRVNYYYLVLTVAVVMTGLTWLLMRSSIGRILRAIRQNENLASACGVAVWKYKLFAFVASAFYAGAAGALYAHYIGFINPETFGVAQSLDAILAVILGGTGTLFGPILGAFAVVFLPEYLRIADSFRLIVYGLLLVVATIFMPRGAAHVLTQAWNFVARRLGWTR